jgi:transposase
MNWYKNEEILRFKYPVVKQYSYGKGLNFEDEMARLQSENSYLRQQVDILKDSDEWERIWYQKS